MRFWHMYFVLIFILTGGTSHAFEPEKILIEAQNAVCPGTYVATCRNPTCPIEGAVNTVNCKSGGYLAGVCQTLDAKEIVRTDAAKFGIDSALTAQSVKDFAILSCEYKRDLLAPKPTPDLCGTIDLDKCPYLGSDSCDAIYQIHSACQNEQYCGINAATCRTILNGVGEQAVAGYGSLEIHQNMSINVFRLIYRNFSNKSISGDEALKYYAVSLEYLKAKAIEKLVSLEGELILKLP